MNNDFEDQVRATELPTTVNASTLLESEPPEPDQIMKDTFDKGDKVAFIASSKLKKTFFLLMFLLCLAAGRPFLSWHIQKPRRILHVQFEIQDHHYHRRVKRMAKAMGITATDLGDRFTILNARGLGIAGPEGIEKIGLIAANINPEIISFDPLYKVATGAENAAEDLKGILNCFDELAKKTGAAILYVHHDPKGNSGDRDVRDRGAGSNVLGRDYDAAITLTPHATELDAAVVETLLRNYRPQEPFTIQWIEDQDTGGYRFEERPDILPEKKTSKTRTQAPALSVYLPASLSILGDEEMEIAPFKEVFKKQTGLGDNRVRDFISWATSGGNPYLITREERGIGKHKKWVKTGRHSNDEE
ncbi:MAG: AAA family ATPase [Deltaproteobacteria bacterium]|nr:AAA family ATPase [Deltaproteobacteria bacterium]